MSMNNNSAYRSPCEILRKINDMFQGDNEKDKKIRELLAECEEKSKQMSIDLHRHRPDYYARWDKNTTQIKDQEFRKSNGYKFHKI